MKKMALMFLLLQTTLLLTASDKPNPAVFPVKVHVVFSRYVQSVGYQQIEALIDGERVELTGFSRGVLALGDYPARITPKVHGPKNPNAYDIYKGYANSHADGIVATRQLDWPERRPASLPDRHRAPFRLLPNLLLPPPGEPLQAHLPNLRLLPKLRGLLLIRQVLGYKR